MMTDAEAMLMAQEGTGPFKDGKFFPYVDSVGKVTIGYGHNLDAKGLPHDFALMLLRGDIADAIDDVRYCFSCYEQLNRPRQLVLISLAFNLGREKLNKFVRFIGAMHLAKYQEAAEHLEDSLAAKQAPVRYQELARMMRDGTSTWV